MKRDIWSRLTGPLVAVLVVAVVFFPIVYSAFRQELGIGTSHPAEKFATKIYVKTNQVRADYGLPHFENCSLMDSLALERVSHIVGYYRESGSLEHHLFNADVSPYIGRLGSVGENAFMINEGLFCFGVCLPQAGASGNGMVDEWMSSYTHRQNILNPDFWFMAVGVERTSNGVIAIQLFSDSC
jgi:uncharacterized protein YkwD